MQHNRRVADDPPRPRGICRRRSNHSERVGKFRSHREFEWRPSSQFAIQSITAEGAELIEAHYASEIAREDAEPLAFAEEQRHSWFAKLRAEIAADGAIVAAQAAGMREGFPSEKIAALTSSARPCPAPSPNDIGNHRFRAASTGANKCC